MNLVHILKASIFSGNHLHGRIVYRDIESVCSDV